MAEGLVTAVVANATLSDDDNDSLTSLGTPPPIPVNVTSS